MNIETQLREILRGIDEDQLDSDHGWWETNKGAQFGERMQTEVLEAVRAHELRLLTSIAWTLYQAGVIDDDGNVETMALSAYEDAVEALRAHGWVTEALRGGTRHSLPWEQTTFLWAAFYAETVQDGVPVAQEPQGAVHRVVPAVRVKKNPVTVHLPRHVHIDVTVTGVQKMIFRVHVAMVFIRAAAWMLGGKGRVAMDKKQDTKETDHGKE